MRRIDVFNGDADGICALRQLRLANPAESELVTGLKHEVSLLERVDAAEGDVVTVLDVSLDRNREALLRLLERGVAVRYFDHHYAGEVPSHPRLQATLDPTGEACTSELVDRYLGGRFRAWAVAGAFGDGFHGAAARLARGIELDAGRLEQLREVGECLNYNAYGARAEDVLVAPEALYRIASRHADPLSLLEKEALLAQIAQKRREDLARAAAVAPARGFAATEVHVLPNASWARRVMGAFANRLALDDPHRAHAVLVPLPGGGYAVSVRAPRGPAPSAADLCRRFPGGGGRVTAAGIERLPGSRLDAFIEAFEATYAHASADGASPRRAAWIPPPHA